MKATCLRTIIALSVLAGGPLGALAQSDTIIIPRQQTATTIPLDWLSGGAIAPILSVVPPARGSLEETNSDFLYTPGADFFAMGFDHFHYSRFGAGLILRDVYLVADLREAAVAPGAFDSNCALRPGWTVQGNITTEATAWSQELCSALVGPSSGPAFLRYEITVVPPDTSPGGGNTGMSLDPGGPIVDGERVILVAHNEKGLSIFDVVQEGMALWVRGRQKDGSMLVSEPMDVPSGVVRIDLGWWLARRPNSRDGGVWLTIDGELQGQVLGIDNHGVDFQPREWRFGRTQGPSETSDAFQIGAMDIWESSEPPVFAPLFADEAETGDLSLWSSVINPQNLAVVSDAGFREIEVQVTPGTTNALVDTSPQGLQNYQARFTLNTARLDLPPGQGIVIFRAPGDTGADLFRVTLSRATDDSGFLVHLGIGSAALAASPAWVALPAAERISLGVRWWAGTAWHPGGVILEVNGEESAELLTLNAGLSMAYTQLGVLAVQSKLFGIGTLRFDGFEAWH